MMRTVKPTKCSVFSNFWGTRRRIKISGRTNNIRPPSSAGIGNKLKMPKDKLITMKNQSGFCISWYTSNMPL